MMISNSRESNEKNQTPLCDLAKWLCNMRQEAALFLLVLEANSTASHTHTFGIFS